MINSKGRNRDGQQDDHPHITQPSSPPKRNKRQGQQAKGNAQIAKNDCAPQPKACNEEGRRQGGWHGQQLPGRCE